MTECYGWYVPTSQKEDVIRVGDKVEIIDAWGWIKKRGFKMVTLPRLLKSEINTFYVGIQFGKLGVTELWVLNK